MITQPIKLSLLENSPDNVRRTGSTAGFAELKASIASHGLMQNLVVVQDGEKFKVIAGSRRLKALKELANDGKMGEQNQIMCRVVPAGNSEELSLVENIAREAMHPADEFEAYSKLLKDGKTTINDVAVRFGCTVRHVEQRMQLGKVAPEIMKAFRDNKLDLKSLMAFTICADHKKQVSAYKSLKEWQRHPHNIKEALTDKMPEADSSVAKYVGRDTYKKAGGTIVADLFSKDEFFENGELLKKLAAEKMSIRVEQLKKEGWGFIELGEDSGWDFLSKFESIDKKPKDLKNCGVYVHIDRDGKLDIKMLKKQGKSSDAALGKKKKGGISEALRADLAAARMEAIQLVIADNDELALDMLAFQAASRMLLPGAYYSANIFGDVTFTKNLPTKSVAEQKSIAKNDMASKLLTLDLSWKSGKTEAEKFRLFCKLTPAKKSAMLAFVFAKTLKPALSIKDAAYEEAVIMSGANLHSYWRPTLDNYFGRITSEQLLAIGKEIFGKDWKPKGKSKRHIAKELHDAFSDPKKSAGGVAETQRKLETWLPSGMAFSPLVEPAKKKK